MHFYLWHIHKKRYYSFKTMDVILAQNFRQSYIIQLYIESDMFNKLRNQ